ncbi:MAG TPA: hypothetical protein VM487_02145 [Phycisphaerae bacterium]|nr:hypothetical protein [Phycisphaerae bacterium]
MFRGWKTYITGAAAIVGAVGGVLTGTVDLGTAAQLVVTSLLAMFVRAGVKTRTGR